MMHNTRSSCMQPQFQWFHQQFSKTSMVLASVVPFPDQRLLTWKTSGSKGEKLQLVVNDLSFLLGAVQGQRISWFPRIQWHQCHVWPMKSILIEKFQNRSNLFVSIPKSILLPSLLKCCHSRSLSLQSNWWCCPCHLFTKGGKILLAFSKLVMTVNLGL